MLTISLSIRDRRSFDDEERVKTYILFEHPTDVPNWYRDLPKPTQSVPTTQWSRLLGDPSHMIRIDATESYWIDNKGLDVAALVRQILRHFDENQTNDLREALTQHPIERYSYCLTMRDASYKRVPREQCDERDDAD